MNIEDKLLDQVIKYQKKLLWAQNVVFVLSIFMIIVGTYAALEEDNSLYIWVLAMPAAIFGGSWLALSGT